MSKFNPNYPAYHVGKKRVSRREWILRHHDEEIADAADQGPFWFGEWGNITSFLPVLTVWSKTDWPRELDLDTVFPLDIEKFTEGWQGKDGLASFLAASKAVQADFDATMAKIGKQHDELRENYFSKKEAAPIAIADLRAMRDECNRVLVGYARRAALSLERVRPAIAVLLLETLRVFDADPSLPGDRLPKETRDNLRQVNFVFAQRFWGNVLQGGPASLTNTDDLIRQLQFPGVSKPLLRFQCEAIYSILEERNNVISEALHVEFRRFAGESILWKIVHGETIVPWNEEDIALLPNQEFPDAATLSNPSKRLAYIDEVLYIKYYTSGGWPAISQVFKDNWSNAGLMEDDLPYDGADPNEMNRKHSRYRKRLKDRDRR